MGTRLHAAPPLPYLPRPTPANPGSPARGRVWFASLALALAAVLPACNTLPDPYMDPQGQETIHTVVETSPGHWHVLVRVNYFSSDDAAERLLRDRVADLCPDGDLVVDDLHVAGVPRIATADVHCAGSEASAPPTTEEPAADVPGADTPAAAATAPGNADDDPVPDLP